MNHQWAGLVSNVEVFAPETHIEHPAHFITASSLCCLRIYSTRRRSTQSRETKNNKRVIRIKNSFGRERIFFLFSSCGFVVVLFRPRRSRAGINLCRLHLIACPKIKQGAAFYASRKSRALNNNAGHHRDSTNRSLPN